MSTHAKLNAYLNELQVPEVYRHVVKKADRPSKYDPSVAEAVLDAIGSGQSLVKACAGPDMPALRTWFYWLSADSALAASYAHARRANAEYMASLVLDTALKCTSETANADKVQIAAYQWLAGKMAPKVYGDKLEVDVTHKVTLESLIIDAFKQLKSEPAPGVDGPVVSQVVSQDTSDAAIEAEYTDISKT